MAQLVNLRFRHEGSDYEISLDFDDAALMDDVIAFDVAARRLAGRREPVSTTARVEFDPGERRVRVLHGEREVASLDLADYEPDSGAERVIEQIPPEIFFGDRVLGCAIRGGVSSTVRAGIECFRSTHEIEGALHRFNGFMRCMAQNFGQISVRALLRTFRCIAAVEGA